MARVAKASKSTKSITPARNPGRSTAVAAVELRKATKSAALKRSAAIVAPTEKRKPGRPAKAHVAPLPKATRATTAAAPPARKVSNEELRAQVEKLEGLIVTLRAKSRETNKAAKAAIVRIAELKGRSHSWKRRPWRCPRQFANRGRRNLCVPGARAARSTQVMQYRRAWRFRSQRLSTRKQRPPLRTWKSTSVTGDEHF
jgi:hypothetical protein